MGAVELFEARDLTGQVVGVTGATSGIGQAACRLLVGAGAKVVASGRRAERLEALVDELGAEHVAAYQHDVRESAKAEGLVQRGLEAFGRFDGLVASAGVGVYGSILDYSDEVLQDMLLTNVAGTIWPIRAAVRHFLGQGGGDVVIVSSVAGLRGNADEAVYAATKFAQVGLAGALDRELAPKGIRVTAICPAGVETEFAIGTGRTAGDPALAQYLRPEDVASAILAVLAQPRRLRTALWSMWPMSQQS
ncbi:SDR family oxidoreductase [Aciditerrimonas ferrireducens]|jgi:3-oxoacyl-[acyl-carrier protein] reductase|uniref:SDR family oxidoreductase n=1 Tax=Aciditerrimonas ferrireducens TaxID=667306 RepID=A0ABV6BYZ5_9ACTN|nr:SDR family oxidoreductase [Aciditerrimonas ferrireducens]MCK4176873.1 SDR family oxidoreductase [Aciditerrimonas ferrireducens]